jgi:hypothetical protein
MQKSKPPQRAVQQNPIGMWIFKNGKYAFVEEKVVIQDAEI